MSAYKLQDELDMIDEAIAKLEDRRTNIIAQMNRTSLHKQDPSKVLTFPGRVTVTRYSSNRKRPEPWN